MKLIELPQDLLIITLKFLDVKDLGKISSVCILLRNLASSNLVWQEKLQEFSGINKFSLHPKQLVRGYFEAMSETNEGFFKGYSMVHSDIKNLILKTPKLKEKLSEETVKEISETNSYFP
ncbi:TPA: hypothetical protein JBE16_14375 [Legionella pneumophila subsp. pneumophila]|uniref:F-box protein n=1 Tax=Legionella sp. PATHC039 TaxID=2992042 RepID=UPI001A1DBA3C|nr:F-box protein [Legionella sp. PATHC039]MCW8395037.1 F-box protein [Legionella sp. PATHC039]HAT8858657.1 hypothetical protein [Legionella pneumophila subsp. pneumophila]HAT9650790.1 hypothetical protein [Legionella pneumophila subsp. pneumophila]HAT9921356.1 hypothetical protein [Legionella pneumophila subsp. pneumophila]